jgi:membrane protease YdiL (CAAX protease family)
VILSTIAGVGYGWVFGRTNRIEASILTHFLVNTAHIVGFTYPALG